MKYMFPNTIFKKNYVICSLDSSGKICSKQVQKQQISDEPTKFKLEKKLN